MQQVLGIRGAMAVAHQTTVSHESPHEAHVLVPERTYEIEQWRVPQDIVIPNPAIELVELPVSVCVCVPLSERAIARCATTPPATSSARGPWRWRVHRVLWRSLARGSMSAVVLVLDCRDVSAVNVSAWLT